MTGGWPRLWAWCNSAAWRVAAPTNSPAGSSSAWPWRARSSTGPRCCCSTSPSARLDLKLRQEMQLELKALQREVGITFVFVTHDQEEALTMSDRIAVMHEGRLLQVGTPEDIYQRPANRFVADFIGRTNLLEATVASPETEVVLSNGMRVEAASEHPFGTKVAVSLRPEQAFLLPARRLPRRVAEHRRGAARGDLRRQRPGPLRGGGLDHHRGPHARTAPPRRRYRPAMR